MRLAVQDSRRSFGWPLCQPPTAVGTQGQVEESIATAFNETAFYQAAFYQAAFYQAGSESSSIPEGGVDGSGPIPRSDPMSTISELAYILRSLRRSPGYTAAVVATLALGIGANAAVFSVVDAVLLRQLPYDSPEEVFRMRERTPAFDALPMSANEIAALREGGRGWATVEALDQLTFNLVGTGGAERVQGAGVTSGFFRMLGVRLQLGRDFTSSPATAEPAPEAILGHALWQSRFGGSNDVLGQEIEMTWSAAFGPARALSERFTVVGVLAENFLPPHGSGEIFVPVGLPRDPAPRHFNYLFPFVRLEGRTPTDAQDAMSRLVAQMTPPDRRSAEEQSEIGVALQPVGESSIARIRSALWILWSAVGLVLLAACANVANLMLTRNTRRQHEIGVRVALGSSRGRLLRWLLGESLVLASAAAVAGIGLAWAGLKLLHSLGPTYLPRLGWIDINPRLMLFALLTAGLTTLLFGVLPGLRAARSDWRSGTRGTSSTRSARRTGASLVIVQVALSVLLLVNAALLVRSFNHLLDVDLGFTTDRLVTFEVALPAGRYGERAQREDFQQQVLAGIGRLPGVTSVDLSSSLPLTPVNTASRLQLPASAEPRERPPQVSYRLVSGSFFETLEVPLQAGRLLAPRDMAQGPVSVLVNRRLAEEHWPGGSPIGELIGLPAADIEQATIVGVVADVRQSGPIRDIRPTVFVPSLGSASFGVAVRLERAGVVSRQQLASVVAEIDPAQPIHTFRTFESPQELWLGRQMFNAWAMSAFGGLALSVSVLGLLAVLSFSVSQRTGEIGIRQALGARASDVLRLITAEGLRLVIIGALVGVALSFASARWVASLLHGVEASDPATLALAVAAALCVALPAILWPARRAAAIAPAVALRKES